MNASFWAAVPVNRPGHVPRYSVEAILVVDPHRQWIAGHEVRRHDGTVVVKAFIDDMATAYAESDLVVARAGALTLAELAIAGRPAILIPLPTAADDHQRKHAERFAHAGAAVVLDQRHAHPEDLATAIAGLAKDAAMRTAMGAAMRGLARPQAAQAIVDRLEGLAHQG